MSNVLPTATAEAESASAGGLASGLDNILVLGCFEKGPFAPRIMAGSKAQQDTFGGGDASEFLCHYFRTVRKKALVQRLPSTNAGAVLRTNSDGVEGSSAITLTGTPLRKFHLVVRFLKGGTIGAAGIEFEYSVNGGLDWSGTIRLGTANTYALPKTGLTLNFGVGDIDAEDQFEAHTSSPKWATGDFADAITAIIEMNVKFRAMIVIGDFSKSEADALKTQIDTLYAAQMRPVVFIAARDWHPDAVLTGGPTLAFADANPDTITRSAGSFITDGFKVGMTITVTGSTSNNGTYTVDAVTATVLTVAEALVVEAAAANRMVTGEETEEAWITSLLADLGSFEDLKGRIVIGAGQTRMVSEIFQVRMRVPVVWAALERWMQHDLQISPNRKKDGALDGHTLLDDDNNVAEHDSRANDALLEARFLTARTFLGDVGAYIGLPATMAPSGSAFGVIPWVAVSNLTCDVVQQATENFIGDNPELNPDGTLTEEERERYQQFVNEELEAELLSPKKEGARASSIAWTASENDVLNVPNSTLNGEAVLVTLGLVGSVHTRVIVNPAA